MAKKVILGTDIARDAFKVKVNDNFTELYNKDVALGEQINNLDALVGLGGVKESGSNVNGKYTKFEDGTMICVHKMSFTNDIAIAAGALFRGDGLTWSFPATFINDIVGITASIGGTTQMFVIGNITTSTGYVFYPVRTVTGTALTFHINLIAIGRWKA